MSKTIIPCGGWYIDENTLSFDENKVLSVVGGGGDAGVSSFNGRTGAVVPQDGDYTADQVGARPDTWTPNATEVGALPITGGTLTGNLVLGDNKITTNSTPSAVSDVTNKGYVDGVVKVVSDEVDGIIAGTTPISVPIATDTKVGGVKVGAGLSVDGEGTLSTAQTYLSTQGGTMTGAIAMGSQKITGLADATDPGDALNKKVGDATYALKTAIPTNATTATAGIVKQATAIEDSSGATDTALETKFNALLAALRTAGVLASS